MHTKQLENLESLRNEFIKLSGTDCYANDVLFPGGSIDREALAWLVTTLEKLKSKEGPNQKRAEHALFTIMWMTVVGYHDHIRSHQLAAAEKQIEELHKTIDHLAGKLGAV